MPRYELKKPLQHLPRWIILYSQSFKWEKSGVMAVRNEPETSTIQLATTFRMKFELILLVLKRMSARKARYL